MRQIGSWFTALEPATQTTVVVFLLSGVPGGTAVSLALADPRHAERWFAVAGGLWIALTVTTALIGWLASRRDRRRDTGRPTAGRDR